MEAIRDHNALESLKSEWSSQFESKLSLANEVCDKAKEVRDNFQLQIDEISAQVNDLTARRKVFEDDLFDLKQAGCTDSIFLQERIKELNAAITALNNEIEFVQIPLGTELSSGVELLDIPFGLIAL